MVMLECWSMLHFISPINYNDIFVFTCWYCGPLQWSLFRYIGHSVSQRSLILGIKMLISWVWTAEYSIEYSCLCNSASGPALIWSEKKVCQKIFIWKKNLQWLTALLSLLWEDLLMYDCPPLHPGEDSQEWVTGRTHPVCVRAQTQKHSVSAASNFYFSPAPRPAEKHCWWQRQCPGSDRHQSYFEGSRGLGIRTCQYRCPGFDPTRSQWTARRVSNVCKDKFC